MDKAKEEQKVDNVESMGNFTKNAVESFEENIVKQKGFLEKVKDDDASLISSEPH
jgi:hypothetical protein